jgi:glycosyltransferase involved in cell wall biosynthesis
MGVYNGASFLKEAIDSILAQTCKDFEFIIINDGSTDDTNQILASYSDPRIKILKNGVNIGLTKSLNLGLKIARGKFIARMDADDISQTNRFKEQVSFLEKNKNISFCGSNVLYLDDSLTVNNFPENHEELKFEMIGRNPFAHPTMMWKREDFIIKGLIYNERFTVAQDYELWSRAILELKGANLSARLVKYRTHENRISEKKIEEVRRNVEIIQRNYLQKCQISLNNDDYLYHNAVFRVGFRDHLEASFLKGVDKYMVLFWKQNLRACSFNEGVLLKKWRDIFFGTTLYKYNIKIMLVGFTSPVNKLVKISILVKTKFIIKCVINYSPSYYKSNL